MPNIFYLAAMSMSSALVESAWKVRHKVLSTLWRRGEVEALQPILQLQFERLGIGLALDVGANRGQYGRLLRRIGFRGHIASYEPVGKNVSILRDVAHRDGNWSVHQFALGATEGQLSINVSKRTEFSSFLTSSEEGRSAFGGEIDSESQEVVDVKRLSDVLPTLRKEHPRGAVHLKLDTQGFDLEVLTGAIDVAHEIESLQTELSFVPLYAGMPGYQQVLSHAAQLDFEMTALIPVSRDNRLRVLEADCLFRRRA